MNKVFKVKWFFVVVFILLTLIVSILVFPTTVQAKKINYKNYYKFVECKECESGYDSNYIDDYGNPRQYGVKMCEKHEKKISEEAKFYDYGYTDYNCLAYSLGETEPCNWKWPISWGKSPKKGFVERYLKWKNYEVEDFDASKMDYYRQQNAVLVYAYQTFLTKEYIVTHFARTTDLEGNIVEGADTISKWGAGGIYSTKTASNPYVKGTGYGECVMAFYKK